MKKCKVCGTENSVDKDGWCDICGGEALWNGDKQC